MRYVLSCFTFLLVLSPLLSPEAFLLFGAALYLPSCFGSRKLLLLTVICSFFLFAPTKSLNSFFSLTDVIIFVVFVRTIWTLRSRTPRGVSPREEILLGMLLVAATLSVMAVAVGGGDVQEGFKEFVRFLQYGAVFYCLLRLIPDLASIDEVERLLIGLAAICSILGMYQFFIGPAVAAARFPWGPPWTAEYEPSAFRVYSVFSNPIYFSAFCSFASPITLERTFRGRRIDWFYAGCLVSILAALTLTFSRTGLVGVLLGSMAVFGKNWRKLLIAAIVMPVLFVLMAPEALMDRILMKNWDAAINVYARILEAQEATRIIREHPAVGIGLGQYPTYVRDELKTIAPQNATDPYTSEDTFLQFGAEMGMLGLVSSVLLALTVLNRSWQLVRRDDGTGRAFFGSVCALGVCNLFTCMTPATIMLFMTTVIVLAKRKYELSLSIPATGVTPI